MRVSLPLMSKSDRMALDGMVMSRFWNGACTYTMFLSGYMGEGLITDREAFAEGLIDLMLVQFDPGVLR